jgi:hypothetical protein
MPVLLIVISIGGRVFGSCAAETGIVQPI